MIGPKWVSVINAMRIPSKALLNRGSVTSTRRTTGIRRAWKVPQPASAPTQTRTPTAIQRALTGAAPDTVNKTCATPATTLQVNSIQSTPSQLSPSTANPSRCRAPCPCHIANGKPIITASEKPDAIAVIGIGQSGARTSTHQGTPCNTSRTRINTLRNTLRRRAGTGSLSASLLGTAG